MEKNGYMKKGKFTDPMIIGGGLFLPVQEKGTRLPYVESKPIWRLVYDEKQKKKHNNCFNLRQRRKEMETPKELLNKLYGSHGVDDGEGEFHAEADYTEAECIAFIAARDAAIRAECAERARHITFEDAEKNVRSTDYAWLAAEQESNPINWPDAAAFYFEGYRRAVENTRAAIMAEPPKVEL